MKIGFDSKRAFKNNTGLGNYSRMIIRALAVQQTQLFLFTPDTKGSYSTFYGNRSNVTVVTPLSLVNALYITSLTEVTKVTTKFKISRARASMNG